MCTKAQLQSVLTDTQNGLYKIFGVSLQKVLLYGSYARGEETSESDIDVMALVDMSREELASYRRAVSDFSSTLDLQYGVLLSIKLQDTETFNRYANTLPFFQNVVREGISVAG